MSQGTLCSSREVNPDYGYVQFLLSTKMAAPSNVINIALSSVTTAVFHPIGYSKILIQIGHEPIASKHGKYMLWGRDAYFYPNIFQYAGHIWNTDGFFGMYTGLLPRLIGSNLGRYVQNEILQRCTTEEKEVEEGEEDVLQNWLKTLCAQTSKESMARICAVVASQPFHVVMIRQMAQFVGGETSYNGFFPAIREVYNTDGLKGFFSGIVPRLIGELVQIWACNLVSSLLSRYLIDSKEIKTYVHHLCGFIISMYTYPFTVVSNIMAVSGTDMVAAQPPNMKPYVGWVDCWTHLKWQNQLNRGSKMYWRVDLVRTAALRRN
ncbi:Mitochondrial carrier 2 [Mactra antiquata]